MVTQLRPLAQEALPSDDTELRALVDQASREIVAQVLPMFTDVLRTLVEQVNATPPTVHVVGPDAPTITVDNAEMAACLTRIEGLMREQLAVQRAPVTTDVIRDTEGNIRQTRATRA